MKLRTSVMVLLSGVSLFAGPAGAQPRAAPPAYEQTAVATPDLAVWMERLMGRFRFEGAIHHEEYVEDLRPQFRDKPQPEKLGFDSDGNPDPNAPTIQVLHPKVSDWSRATAGKGDCIGVNDGPGLQCVISVAWDEVWRGGTGKAQLGGVSDLNPAMIQAGLAPVSGGIRFLEVDSKGLAHPGRLVLNGNSAIMKPPCVNRPGVRTCEIVIKIDAGADARIVFAQVTNTVNFTRSRSERLAGADGLENVEEIVSLSFAMHREAQDGEQAVSPARKP